DLYVRLRIGPGRGVRKAHRYPDQLAPGVWRLFVQPEYRPVQPALGEEPHRLDPEMVEVQLVLAETPAPGLVKPEEHRASPADDLLDYQRVLAGAGVRAAALLQGRPVGVERQVQGSRLALVAFRPPVDLGQLVPDGQVLRVVAAEAEDRVVQALVGQHRPEPLLAVVLVLLRR